jgi:DNA-binding response OmpR family regulator
MSVLVVDTNLDELAFATSVLAANDFHVVQARSFEEAKLILLTNAPDLLVAAVRLGEYNGLHLVLRGKAARPQMAAIVLSPDRDPVLLTEADDLQATFVVTPTLPEEFAAAVLRTVFPASAEPRCLRPPFERRRLERRVSFGLLHTGADRRVMRDRRRASGTVTVC